MIERTLLIRSEPLDKILRRTKTWEIRKRSTNIRGRIALSEIGAKRIVGTCKISHVVGPLSINQVLSNAGKMGRRRSDIQANLSSWRRDCRNKKVFAWVLSSVRRFRHPVAFKYRSGPVTWARVPASIAKKL